MKHPPVFPRVLAHGGVKLAVLALFLLGSLLFVSLWLSWPIANASQASSTAVDTPILDVSLVTVATGFDRPTVITHAGDDRLFIAEQEGVIRIINGAGDIEPTPFLSITVDVNTGIYEQGLLGFTFHPDYESNGYFYVYYTAADNSSQIVRYTVSGDPDVADPASAFPILSVPQPAENNNGGDMHFGPDGYLYIALGDGGGVGDPNNLAQDGGSLLGKLLRIDVDGTTSETNYLIPADNPFVGDTAVRDEIWAIGFRNPWRFSFDRLTGDLYLGDVGLVLQEEINFQPASSGGGENYGWRCYEGTSAHNIDGCAAPENYTFPAYKYWHYEGDDWLGCSVTGGAVYRGEWSPALIGRYIFADYCTGRFWAMSPSVANPGQWSIVSLGQLLNNVSAFGEGANGELYVAGHADGTIRRIKSAPTTPEVSLTQFATGFSSPVGIVNSGVPDDDRLFVVQQGGLIRILESDGTIRPTAFLNLTGQVSTGGERGLLGLAFHPDYATNGYFYVNYTDTSGDTAIARYTVSDGDANVANPSSQLLLLTVDQPFSNHNAGDMAFGPDGYLYIPMGDGGSSGDPGDRSQNMTLLLGKLLRIDVDPTAGLAPDCGSGVNYSIPADNPFVGEAGTCNEIWAAGLRNSWRISFDRELGDLYIADVGQNAWEEINWQSASSAGGENYGWRCYEGNATYNTTDCGPASDYDFPIHVYNHSGGSCSLTGGYVYRGTEYPFMVGHYIYADYCSGLFWALHPDGDGGWQNILLGPLLSTWSVSTFGEDIDGEMYVAHRGSGVIYRLHEDTPPPPKQTPTPLPTETSTPEGTPTATPTGTLTATPENGTPTATPAGTLTATPEGTLTPTPEGTLTPTPTGTVEPSPTVPPILSEELFLPLILQGE